MSRQRKNKRYQTIMPKVIDVSKLAFMAGDTLWICMPLTPSQNETHHSHWSFMLSYQHDAYFIALSQARTLLGRSYQRPWTDRARLSIVRCSDAYIRLDYTNIYGGAKEAIDVLTMPRAKAPWRIGIVTDDDPDHLELGTIEDRLEKNWAGLDGPATWIGLTPI